MKTYWTSEDKQNSIDMGNLTPEQAVRQLLEQCSDDTERGGILDGTIDIGDESTPCREIVPPLKAVLSCNGESVWSDVRTNATRIVCAYDFAADDGLPINPTTYRVSRSKRNLAKLAKVPVIHRHTLIRYGEWRGLELYRIL